VVDGLASPKAGVVLGPWAETEVYLQGGLGFHSNDARGTTLRVDPVTGSDTDVDGNPLRPADPLVRTYGAEVGVRTTWVRGWQSTLSYWWLDIDSELLFVGDAGTTEASRPSRRHGLEWANYYRFGGDWVVDADVSFSHAEFRDDDPAGDEIPGAVESVVAAGLGYLPERGVFGSVRLRYFGPRPLVEDNSFRSGETLLVGVQVGYRWNPRWVLTAEVFNLLNRRDHDIDYAYESRVTPSSAAETQLHYHPVEPVQVRVGLTARF
jgi:outer membrane receptor protein involved in Fe transport